MHRARYSHDARRSLRRHSCGSSLLVPQAFQASEQCADLAQVNFRRFSAAGPLGTVIGMVTVFRTISENVSPDPTMLAGGIWTALITTVMGLVVAIPALMAYYYLMLKVKELRIEAVEYSYRALNIRREPCRCAQKMEEDEQKAA